MFSLRSTLALALAFSLATASIAAAQEDLVIGFIVEADSVFQAAGEAELTQYIHARAPLVGAAVGTLLEIGFEIGMQGDRGPEQENLEFAQRIAAVHADAGESEGPRDYLDRYRAWSEEDRAAKLEAQALEGRAVEARGEGDYDLALAKYAEAAAIYDRIGDTRALAVLWGSRGVVHFYRSDFESMENAYRKALPLRRQIDDRILVGKTLNGMGTVHFMTDRYPEAAEWYGQAVELRRETEDRGGLVTSLTYLGNVHYQQGELAPAAALYGEAESLLRDAGEDANLQRAQLLNSQAAAERELGNLDRAKELYHQALELNMDLDDAVSTVSNRLNLAQLLTAEGRYSEAMRQLELCEPLLEVGVTADYITMFHILRGEVYRFVGDLESARDELVQARRMAAEYEMGYEEVEVMLSLATLYSQLGYPDQGLDLSLAAAEKAEAAQFSRLLRDSFMRAGDCAVQTGDYEAGLGYYERAVTLSEELRDAETLAGNRVGLANSLAMLKREEEAREVYRSVIAEARESGMRAVLPRALIGLAHTYEDADPARARQHYTEALDALDELRSAAGAGGATTFFANETGYLFQEIARYYAELHAENPEGTWAGEALRVTEQSRSRGLLDRVGDGGSRLASIEELQRALPDRSLLLQFALGDSASFLWAIDREGVQLVSLPPKRQLQAPVERLRAALSTPGAGDQRLIEASRSLYRTLLEPVAEQLASADALVIVPDATLYLLPFELLLEEDPRPEEDITGQVFLGRRLSTSYAPSSTVWLRLKAMDDPASRSPLLAMGNPDFDGLEGVELVALPYSQDEVERVGRRVNSDASKLLFGSDATETALRTLLASDLPMILHLATHGLVDPAEPERSCVALAADEVNDGFLYSVEIEALSDTPPLVVLSACETATGRVLRGEGVVGLGRSFLASGTRGVVASLWPVSDESTAVLMDAFYAHLLQGKGAAASLAAARMVLLGDERYGHPFHWAAFILVGDASAPSGGL